MGNIKEIHKACLNNDLKKFNFLIKRDNFIINERDNINFTPLMCACFSGNVYMVKKLLKFKKVLINARSNNKKTALIIAATRGHLDIVKLLINSGAKTNLKQYKNSKKICPEKTALNVALQCHHPKVSKYLKGKKTSKTNRYKNWKV
jgi:uncharacterized protein